ncbi:hypothetical protein K2Z83_15185 [Oscillochloris sp. ZM17-4]|uniref:hypothetical protein n=1 Tax=Oscillochloris sp. ZM17-4 TaxID=2866714 RepID=UPI001C72E54A|nr:hypothetical protein [Oscillochloris sp. ZM17-4]MBX0329021.1 hypothetical protein [Oscillochloris sp. ZM17-4]
MTATPAGRLLISHIPLRGPELAQLYAAIASRPGATLDDLRAALCAAGAGDSPDDLADAPLREALSFLAIAGLIEARGRPRRHTAAPRLPGAPFRLLLSHHLAAHPERRQRAIALVHRQLVSDDTLAITPQALRDQMERGPLRDLFAWTGEKLALWAHLSAFVGLVRRSERSPDLLIVPQPGLVLDALRWASTQSTPLLADALTLIDAELFACFTARGRVHRGLAQTLLAMERLGHIRMTHHADAARSLLLGDRRVSQVELLDLTKRV